MPDIIIPNTFVDGVAADADLAMENTYLPKALPDNPEVINGRLTNPNRDGWTIGREDVRRGHFSESRMVGATANQDYFPDFYEQVPPIEPYQLDVERLKRALVVPGCGISFYVPWTVTAVALNWHVSLITDRGQLNGSWPTAPWLAPPGGANHQGVGPSAENSRVEGDTWLALFIDGHPVLSVRRRFINGHRTMAYDRNKPINKSIGARYGGFWYDHQRPDHRFWTGSFVYDYSIPAPGAIGSLLPSGATNYIEPGWHTASIRIMFYPYNNAEDFVDQAGIKQARVKTRRMGYTLIR